MDNEIWNNIGVGVAGLLVAVAAYLGKRVPKDPPSLSSPQPPVITTPHVIDHNLKIQVDQIILELKRVGDCLSILSDRKQSDMANTLQSIRQRLDDMHDDKDRSRGG